MSKEKFPNPEENIEEEKQEEKIPEKKEPEEMTLDERLEYFKKGGYKPSEGSAFKGWMKENKDAPDDKKWDKWKKWREENEENFIPSKKDVIGEVDKKRISRREFFKLGRKTQTEKSEIDENPEEIDLSKDKSDVPSRKEYLGSALKEAAKKGGTWTKEKGIPLAKKTFEESKEAWRKGRKEKKERIAREKEEAEKNRLKAEAEERKTKENPQPKETPQEEIPKAETPKEKTPEKQPAPEKPKTEAPKEALAPEIEALRQEVSKRYIDLIKSKSPESSMLEIGEAELEAIKSHLKNEARGNPKKLRERLEIFQALDAHAENIRRNDEKIKAIGGESSRKEAIKNTKEEVKNLRRRLNYKEEYTTFSGAMKHRAKEFLMDRRIAAGAFTGAGMLIASGMTGGLGLLAIPVLQRAVRKFSFRGKQGEALSDVKVAMRESKSKSERKEFFGKVEKDLEEKIKTLKILKGSSKENLARRREEVEKAREKLFVQFEGVQAVFESAIESTMTAAREEFEANPQHLDLDKTFDRLSAVFLARRRLSPDSHINSDINWQEVSSAKDAIEEQLKKVAKERIQEEMKGLISDENPNAVNTLWKNIEHGFKSGRLEKKVVLESARSVLRDMHLVGRKGRDKIREREIKDLIKEIDKAA